jgi:3-hydroxyacyl-CoA dehydrogenase
LAENQFVQHVAMGDVHVLRLANPPVNTLRTEIRAGLYDGMKAARAAGAKAVVIIGTGRMFCAGAENHRLRRPD